MDEEVSETDGPEDWEWASTDEEDLMGFGITLEEHQAPKAQLASTLVQQKKEQEPGNISPETNLVVGGSWHTTTLRKNVFSELK